MPGPELSDTLALTLHIRNAAVSVVTQSANEALVVLCVCVACGATGRSVDSCDIGSCRLLGLDLTCDFRLEQ
jgi:hypothetical protein